MNTKAEPRFDRDLGYGQQGELLINEYLEWIARKNGRVEIKRKTRLDWYVYVETRCDKGRTGTYQPSGINVSTADAWAFVFGDTGIALFVPADVIKGAFRQGFGKALQEHDGSCPTHGRLFNLQDFIAASQAESSA